MYLLDTNVVSELRRPCPNRAVLDWIADVPAEQLFLSAVTVGEIQAGIEITREQDAAKAEELEAWLDRIPASYGVLPMDAPAFREWASLMHGRSDTMTEDAMIAAYHQGGACRQAGRERVSCTQVDEPGPPLPHEPSAEGAPSSGTQHQDRGCRRPR